MIKAVVFDVGRTLMEYVGMPNSWKDYYPAAIRNIRDSLRLDVSDKELERSLEIFTSYSPRVNYREVDYSPEHIFADVISEWRCRPELSKVISAFFDSMKLRACIYRDAKMALRHLRRRGIKVAALTDVATGMPDELHKSYFGEIMPYFNIYVSSVSCGYRKPNPRGLEIISEELGVSPIEMIMVGDERKDIEVAKRFGCKSVLIDRAGEGNDFGQDYAFKDLHPLSDLIYCLNADISRFSPCGRNCADCEHINDCSGCNGAEGGGEFSCLWPRGCQILPCSREHKVRLCCYCPEFPCDTLSGFQYGSAVRNLKVIARIYKSENDIK